MGIPDHAMRRCDGAVERCDGVIARCDSAVPWSDDAIHTQSLMTIQNEPIATISFCFFETGLNAVDFVFTRLTRIHNSKQAHSVISWWPFLYLKTSGSTQKSRTWREAHF